MYTAMLLKDTMFGAHENVINVPSIDYDFSEHTSKVYENVVIKTPLLMTQLVLIGQYTIDLDRYDYMILKEKNTENNTEEILGYYFVNSIVGDNVNIALSLTLDVVTTHKLTQTEITGTIIRKHDVNPNEGYYDYPNASKIEAVQYEIKAFDIVAYDIEQIRLIESAVDLSEVAPSQVINAGGGANIVVPTLPKPTHTTVYGLETYNTTHYDRTGAFTLYDADLIDTHVLNTVRGLSGDGAISDSYSIPSEAVTITREDSGITSIIGKNLFKVTTINPKEFMDSILEDYVIKNKAIYGGYRISIQSTITKDIVEFEGFNIKDSFTNGLFTVNLWCDAKPSGNPYCAPTQVTSIVPVNGSSPNDLAAQDYKSVKGKQWVRNPLIYTTAQGSKFAEIEAELQRRQAKNEYDNAMVGLNIGQKEREIQMAQAEFAMLSSNVSAGVATLSSAKGKDVGGLIGGIGSLIGNYANKGYSEQVSQLRDYEFTKQKEMLEVSLKSNLNNINIANAISRAVPTTIVNSESDSLASYERYNAFSIIFNSPDRESLISKDIEYSLYGYPTYEFVNDFIMNDNLRVNQTVYQFQNPIIDLGGVVGQFAKQVLESGIRILSNKYSRNNLLNNPKRT